MGSGAPAKSLPWKDARGSVEETWPSIRRALCYSTHSSSPSAPTLPLNHRRLPQPQQEEEELRSGIPSRAAAFLRHWPVCVISAADVRSSSPPKTCFLEPSSQGQRRPLAAPHLRAQKPTSARVPETHQAGNGRPHSKVPANPFQPLLTTKLFSSKLQPGMCAPAQKRCITTSGCKAPVSPVLLILPLVPESTLQTKARSTLPAHRTMWS